MAPAPQLKAAHFDGIDALRAVAAVMVVEFHAVGIFGRGAALHAWIRPWILNLDVGVQIFFVISAFLLYRPFVRARDMDVRAATWPYAWRRIVRIVPGYWTALIFTAIVLGATASILSLHGFARYFLFTQSYTYDTASGGLPVAWTLCIEVAFYAFLPVWAWAVRRVLGSGSTRGELPALAGLFAVGVAWKLWVLGTQVGSFIPSLNPWVIALPSYFDVFALGMVVAVLSVRWQERGGAPERLRRTSGWWWVAGLALFVFAAKGAGLTTLDPRGFTHQQFLVRHMLLGLVAICALMPAVLGTGVPARVLRWAPLREAGRVSYGIYLYHLTVFGVLTIWGFDRWSGAVHPYLLWGVGGLALTFLVAEVSFRLIERPALSLKSWAGPGLRRAATARPPAG